MTRRCIATVEGHTFDSFGGSGGIVPGPQTVRMSEEALAEIEAESLSSAPLEVPSYEDPMEDVRGG